MKVCFPVVTDEGMGSNIYGHFASAPCFLIVDTVTRQTYTLANCDGKNLFSGCNPFIALRDQELDGIVVAGIGDDALRTMNSCGFRVYEANSSSVRENAELFEHHALTEALLQNSHLEGSCNDQEGARTCGHCHS
jgi:predicted Fe-Mo cluster-binding NifX family protein